MCANADANLRRLMRETSIRSRVPTHFHARFDEEIEMKAFKYNV